MKKLEVQILIFISQLVPLGDMYIHDPSIHDPTMRETDN